MGGCLFLDLCRVWVMCCGVVLGCIFWWVFEWSISWVVLKLYLFIYGLGVIRMVSVCDIVSIFFVFFL